MGAIRLHSLNDVKLVGRLTKHPELRFTPQGTPVCRFRIAVGRKYKDRTSGEWKEEVAFVPCSVWRESAERCGQRLKKGSPVFIEGRLKSRDWTTKEGQKRSDLEIDIQKIQFLDSQEEGENGSAAPQAVAAGVGAKEISDEAAPITDDEVPF